MVLIAAISPMDDRKDFMNYGSLTTEVSFLILTLPKTKLCAV